MSNVLFIRAGIDLTNFIRSPKIIIKWLIFLVRESVLQYKSIYRISDRRMHYSERNAWLMPLHTHESPLITCKLIIPQAMPRKGST
jgi:hypothetical protein